MKTPLPVDGTRVPCRTSPDSWFPEKGDSQTAKLAKHLCKTICPVVDACAEHGIRYETGPGGIWGGLSAEERRRIRVNRGIVAVPLPLSVAYPRREAS